MVLKGGSEMEQFNEQLAVKVDGYIEALLNPPDAALLHNLKDAESSGLPAINVSPNEGKLLYLVTKIAGAKRVLEIGTLGGYSTTWLARALPADGKVITLELDQKRGTGRQSTPGFDHPADHSHESGRPVHLYCEVGQP